MSNIEKQELIEVFKHYATNRRPCYCGNQKKFKSCCEKLYRTLQREYLSENTTIGKEQQLLTTYLSFFELWPKAQPNFEELKEEILQYDPRDLLQTLSKINYIAFKKKKEKEDNLWFLRLFDIEDYYKKKIILWIESDTRSIVVHRQALLFLMNVVIENHDIAKGKKKCFGNTKNLLEIILKTNHFLNFREHAVSDNRKDTLATLYSNARMMFSSNAGDNIARYWGIVNTYKKAHKYEKQTTDFISEFQNKFRMQLIQFLGTGVGIWQHYNKEIDELLEKPENFILGKGYFNKLSFDANSIYEYLSKDLTGHSKELKKELKRCSKSTRPFNFISIYDSPLFKTKDDTYYPLDLTFLTQNITEGLYWHLRKKYDSKTTIGSNSITVLNSSFGYLAEYYVLELIEDSKKYNINKDIITKFEFYSEIEGCDFLIKENNTVLAIEFTTQTITMADSISSNYDTISKSLKKLWIDGIRKKQKGKGKLVQLEKFYNQIRNEKEADIYNIKINQETEIIPIFLSLHPIPTHPFLLPWYQEIMQENGLASNFVSNCMILSLEDFEHLLAALDNKYSITQLIKRYQASGLNGHSITNWTRIEGYNTKNPYMNVLFNKAFNEIENSMFRQ